MNDTASLRYLDSFQNFEKMTLSRSPRWNLARMKFLLAAAGHPEKSFFPVLIVGTKGKGSTGFLLESVLNASGTSSGFYSSPHLETPRERIRLRGAMISKASWTREMNRIRSLLSKRPVPARLGSPTYFEIMTLMAALAFKREGIRVGIFEAGMGGRWDAVNAMDAKLVVVTPIHLDHEAVLGNTIAKITGEKAAVIRPRAHVVVAPQVPEARKVIEDVIKRNKTFAYWSKPLEGYKALKGDYQRVNAGAAVQAALILGDIFGFKVTAKGINQGLKAETWPGRYEVFHKKGAEWVLDAAHNPISIEALVRNLRRDYANRPRTLIFGTSRDKNAPVMLKTLGGYFKEIILTRAASSRSAEIPALMVHAKSFFEKVYPVPSVREAMRFAVRKAEKKSWIAVTGSFFVIGEARKELKPQTH